MNFIRNCIDIGFCDTDKVTLIFKLVGLILSSTSDDCKVANSFSKILEYAKNQTRLKPKVKMISLNAIKILEVLGHLRLQTQLVVLLKYFMKYKSCRNEVEKNISQVFNIFSLVSDKSKSEELNLGN